jgi:hypothetical protein
MWKARREISFKKEDLLETSEGKDKYGELSVDGGNIKMGLIK